MSKKDEQGREIYPTLTEDYYDAEFGDVELSGEIKTKPSKDANDEQQIVQTVTYKLLGTSLRTILKHFQSSANIKVQSRIRLGTLPGLEKDERTDDAIVAWMTDNPTLEFNVLTDMKPKRSAKSNLEKSDDLMDEMPDSDLDELIKRAKAKKRHNAAGRETA